METSYATLRPGPALAGYVTRLLGARLSAGVPERQRELPIAGTALILALDHRWRIGVDERAPLVEHRSFAGGLTLTPAVSEHGGAYDLVEAYLTPAGSAAVLGVPAAQLAGEVVALDALLGPQAALLAEQVAELESWDARLSSFEAWLASRIARRPAPLSPDASWALRRLETGGGRVAISTLQDEIGCSRRHLAARFAREVGTTPKVYAQLVRFESAVGRLRAGEAPAAVAAACGYADQAHLTRHVRRFGSTTPAALRGDPAPVTNVQDRAASVT